MELAYARKSAREEIQYIYVYVLCIIYIYIYIYIYTQMSTRSYFKNRFLNIRTGPYFNNL